MTDADSAALVAAFGAAAMYIADGHHRAASAARPTGPLRQGGAGPTDADRFIAVAFPDTQVQILRPTAS